MHKLTILSLVLTCGICTACANSTGKANPENDTITKIMEKADTIKAITTSAELSDSTGSVWDKLKATYSADKSVNQLLFIECTGGTKAEALYLKKNADGTWTVDMQRTADIGLKGLGKVKEGDKKTPEGDFSVRQAFGILDNPGTTHKYYKVTNDTYCCGDHCKYYNTIIEASKLKHKCNGEHLIKYHPQYDYGFEITYNNNNVIGKGSAVFVHCKGTSGYTLGCIALDKDMMKHIIQDSDPGIKICIHKK